MKIQILKNDSDKTDEQVIESIKQTLTSLNQCFQGPAFEAGQIQFAGQQSSPDGKPTIKFIIEG